MAIHNHFYQETNYTGFSTCCKQYEASFKDGADIYEILEKFRNKDKHCTLVVSCTGKYYTYHEIKGWETKIYIE